MTTRSEPEVLATYTMQLIGPNRFDGPFPVEDMVPPALLRETEENLTDLMPQGYRIEIKEWSE